MIEVWYNSAESITCEKVVFQGDEKNIALVDANGELMRVSPIDKIYYIK